MKKEIVYKILFLTVLFSLVVVNVWAMYNSGSQTRSTSYASAVGTNTINTINTVFANEVLNDSLQAYNECGYTPLLAIIDPKPLVLLSRVTSGVVQLYVTHGDDAADRIVFPKCGLIKGNVFESISEGKTYYGVNAIDWTGKKLVTLSACNSAGSDTVAALDSIAAAICQSGCEMTVGWYTKIPALTGRTWLERYHDKLEDGSTVEEAATYANRGLIFFLEDPQYSNKNCRVFYHGNSSTSITINSRNNQVINDNLVKKFDNNSKLFDKSDLENCMKGLDSKFDLDDYYIVESEGLYACNVDTNVDEKVEGYVDIYFKKGDYITNSAYTVVLNKNDKIKEIYDYTKNNELQKNVNNRDENYFKVNDKMIKEYLEAAKLNHKNEVVINESILFQYDIINDKRFVVVSLTFDENAEENYKVYKYDV